VKEKFTKFEFEIVDDTFVYALNNKGVNQFDFNINGNGDYGADLEELKANAHLIAAAPKMYKEIGRDIEWLERLAKKYVIGSYELQGIQSRIENKRKLLSEARGE